MRTDKSLARRIRLIVKQITRKKKPHQKKVKLSRKSKKEGKTMTSFVKEICPSTYNSMA